MLAGSVLTSNRLGIFFVVVVTEAESFKDSISCIPSKEHTLHGFTGKLSSKLYGKQY